MKGSSRRNSNWSRCALALALAGVGAPFAGCADPPKTVPVSAHGGNGASAGRAGSSASGRSGESNDAGTGDQVDNAGSGGDAGQNLGEVGGFSGASHAGSAGIGEAGQNSGMAGEGGSPCDSGLVTCPGGPTCGTDLSTGHAAQDTVDDCGACGVSCSLTQATSAACVAGACKPACATGFTDCDTTTNDGCETDTTTSVSHCGQCGRACSSFGTTSRVCAQQVCAPVCGPKYADCNVDTGSGTDDGCERYLDSLGNCGTTCANGVACSPAQVCNAGACGAPQGLVQMSVPLTSAAQIQRYADVFNPPPDLTNTTLMLRMYAPNATGGALAIYMTDISSDFAPTVTVPLNTLTQGWTDVSIPIGGVAGPFDPSAMHQVTIEVTGGSSTAWQTPATVIYIDGIWTSNLQVNDTFDSTLDGMIGSSLQTVSGSMMTWVDSLP